MKKLIAYPLSWGLYYIGDFICSIPDFPYPIYSQVMLWSLEVQEYGELESPWKSNNTK